MKRLLVLFPAVLVLCCAKPTTTETTLSSLPFDVTGSPLAMPDFQKGLLLLHNFEYQDAQEAFLEAQKKDPGFVMAYWGEAMTYDHPIWRDLNIDAARKALQKLGATTQERHAKIKSELERDFIAGIEILFGEGSKPDREKMYSLHMEKVYQKYPGNHEVAAFYALSLLGTKNGWSEWEPQNAKSAEICEAILKENPNHPGALHYLVHADDHPQYAKYGLSAADKYAKAASYAGHALHMPSHIYLALGKWDDVVRSNEVSWQASIDRKTRKNLDNDSYNYHAHIWLQYGYLQQGRFDRAKELMNNQIHFTSEKSTPRSRSALAEMKGHYLFETNAWTSSLANLSVETNDLDFSAQDDYLLIDAASAFYRNDPEALKTIINDFEKKIEKLELVAKSGGKESICGVQRYVAQGPTQNDIERGQRYIAEFKALQAWLASDMKKADQYFKEALPRKEVFISGPPTFFKSPYEFYGEFLLANSRPDEAYENFQLALRYSPKRILALKGSLAAAKKMNDSKKMTDIKSELEEILKNADATAKNGL